HEVFAMAAVPPPDHSQRLNSASQGTRSPNARRPTVLGNLVLSAGVSPLPDYLLIQLLGRGGFGEVWKARGPGGFDIALKFVSLGNRASEVELRALELMKQVRHPNVLGLHGAWQRDGFLILAMELGDVTL